MHATTITLLNSDGNIESELERYMEFHPDYIIYENEVYKLLHRYEPYEITYQWAGSSISIE